MGLVNKYLKNKTVIHETPLGLTHDTYLTPVMTTNVAKKIKLSN